MDYAYADIAGMIDHALLAPNLTTEELEAGCRLAREYEVASVCVLPWAVKRADELLSGTTVQPTTTVGFPHGGQATGVKAAEAEQALADGATELDMVVNISKVKSADWDYVREDIAAVLEPTHRKRMKLKVIFETCYLAEAEKIRLCEICGELGRGLGEDVDGLRRRGRDRRGPHPDEDTLTRVRAGEGLGRHPGSRPVAPGAGAGLHAVRRERDEGHSRRAEAPPGGRGREGLIS